jgi:hypothetical protein
MMLLKGCGRCNGDIIMRGDIHGKYLQCLMCSRVKYLETMKEINFRHSNSRRRLFKPTDFVAV